MKDLGYKVQGLLSPQRSSLNLASVLAPARHRVCALALSLFLSLSLSLLCLKCTASQSSLTASDQREKTYKVLRTFAEGQSQNLALTVSYVPYSLDSGTEKALWTCDERRAPKLAIESGAAPLGEALVPGYRRTLSTLTPPLPPSHFGCFYMGFRMGLASVPYRSGPVLRRIQGYLVYRKHPPP